jgi:hypothetical protein
MERERELTPMTPFFFAPVRQRKASRVALVEAAMTTAR